MGDYHRERKISNGASGCLNEVPPKAVNLSGFLVQQFLVSQDVVVVLSEAMGFVPLENMLAFIDVLHAQSGYKRRY